MCYAYAKGSRIEVVVARYSGNSGNFGHGPKHNVHPKKTTTTITTTTTTKRTTTTTTKRTTTTTTTKPIVTVIVTTASTTTMTTSTTYFTTTSTTTTTTTTTTTETTPLTTPGPTKEPQCCADFNIGKMRFRQQGPDSYETENDENIAKYSDNFIMRRGTTVIGIPVNRANKCPTDFSWWILGNYFSKIFKIFSK